MSTLKRIIFISRYILSKSFFSGKDYRFTAKIFSSSKSLQWSSVCFFDDVDGQWWRNLIQESVHNLEFTLERKWSFCATCLLPFSLYSLMLMPSLPSSILRGYLPEIMCLSAHFPQFIFVCSCTRKMMHIN